MDSMQPILRRRATGSQNNNFTEDDHAEDKHLSMPMAIFRRCLSAISTLLDQDYESVQAILLNLGIVAALLLSIIVSLLLTVPTEESARGDIEFVPDQCPLPLSLCATKCHYH